MAYDTTCALHDGATWCWGELEYNQHTLKPKNMASTGWTSLFIDERGTRCGHERDGRVECSSPFLTFPKPTPSFAMDRMVGCGADPEGRVHCKRWDLDASAVESATLDQPRDVIHLSMHGRPCAVQKSGRVVCWRFDYDHLIVEERQRIDGIDSAVEIATSSHACARLRSGEVACFGQNDAGQLGDASLVAHPKSGVLVEGLTDAVQVAVGTDFSCARRENGSVVCWGERGPLLGDGVAPGTGPVWVELETH